LEVTLHVGLGTFMPVQPEQLEQKKLHLEVFELSTETATAINHGKLAGKKIVAVGTTTTRVLESCAQAGQLVAQSGSTQLFIQPGDKFQIVDGLITNFHVPKSSLLMLVSAFTSKPNTSHPFQTFLESPVGYAYQEAIQEKYRLFSFGDAMLIW
jgi:S-adenosylmethionine:tRNA ribosyltransferase-isomerase